MILAENQGKKNVRRGTVVRKVTVIIFAVFFIISFMSSFSMAEAKISHEERVQKIFERIVRLADKKPPREPKLIITAGRGSPSAMANGEIRFPILSIEECYKDGDALGDARIAFILSHEIAHIALDHHGAREFYGFIQKSLEKEDYKGIAELLERTEDLDIKENFFLLSSARSEGERRRLKQDLEKRVSDIRKRKELEADRLGIFYMLLAGYDPRAVVSRAGGINYVADFEKFLGQAGISYEAASATGHPTADERAKNISLRIEPVLAHYELFRIGIRLYHLEMYYQAASIFETLRKIYPAREVYNNLGASRYQEAMKTLSGCNQADADRFRVSAALDPVTPLDSRGEPEKKCLEKKDFRDSMKQAAENFKKALDNDPSYKEAFQNYSAALIWLGDYTSAIDVATKAIRKDPHNWAAMNNLAIAEYLYDGTRGVSGAAHAMGRLKAVPPASPFYADALYNMGRILNEQGNTEKAREAWGSFLSVEQYDTQARRLAKTQNIPYTPRKTSEKVLAAPGVFPGSSFGDALKKIGIDPRNVLSFEIDLDDHRFFYEVAKKDNLRIVARGGKIIYVEKDAPAAFAGTGSPVAQYGVPERIVTTYHCRSYIYGNNFGFDEEGGRIVRTFWFLQGL